MKKKIIVLLSLLCALVMAWSVAPAEESLHGLVARVNDPENPAVYTLATTEYDVMKPAEPYAPGFTELLSKAVLTPADASETPEGEYVVLAFPEEKVRFDFFEGDPEKNYIRQVNPDGTEELFRATLPEDVYITVSGLMSAEATALAEALGIVPGIRAVLPEEGWVLDGIEGSVWQDDRASLELFLEDTDNYKVLIRWGSSAWEMTEWVYACNYDAERQELKAVYVICDNVKYDDKGEEERTVVYEKESEALISLNAEGRVEIRNAGDEALEGKTFEKIAP